MCSSDLLAPDSVVGWFTIGLIEQRRRRRRTARAALRRAVQLVSALPGDHAIEGADGLTVGRLRQVTQNLLGSTGASL